MSIFPYPWRPRSVWNPAKKCSGNCWIAANYTWSETNYRQSKPLKGPPNPPKSRRRPKNRLLKANGAVDLTEVTHDRPVSEKLSPPFGSAYEILGLVAGPEESSELRKERSGEDERESRSEGPGLEMLPLEKGPAGGPFSTVKGLACVDALRDELLARSPDVGDDEEHCFRRTGCGRCEVYAELN